MLATVIVHVVMFYSFEKATACGDLVQKLFVCFITFRFSLLGLPLIVECIICLSWKLLKRQKSGRVLMHSLKQFCQLLWWKGAIKLEIQHNLMSCLSMFNFATQCLAQFVDYFGWLRAVSHVLSDSGLRGWPWAIRLLERVPAAKQAHLARWDVACNTYVNTRQV